MVIFLILYVDDILLIGNDVRVLSIVKIWLTNHLNMKDLGEANYLGIKLLRDRQNKMLGLTQAIYIYIYYIYICKIFVKFVMLNSKKNS